MTRCWKRGALVALAVGVLSTAAASESSEPHRDRNRSTGAPIAEMRELRPGLVYVELQRLVPLSSAVDMGVFAPLSPTDTVSSHRNARTTRSQLEER